MTQFNTDTLFGSGTSIDTGTSCRLRTRREEYVYQEDYADLKQAREGTVEVEDSC